MTDLTVLLLEWEPLKRVYLDLHKGEEAADLVECAVGLMAVLIVDCLAGVKVNSKAFVVRQIVDFVIDPKVHLIDPTVGSHKRGENKWFRFFNFKKGGNHLIFT